MSSEAAVGRPRRPYTFGPLYDLLKTHFPDHRSPQGLLDIPRLARDMGFAHETIYRAVRGNAEAGYPDGMLKIPVALQIIRFSHENHPEEPIYWTDLLPFVLPFHDKFSNPMTPTET